MSTEPGNLSGLRTRSTDDLPSQLGKVMLFAAWIVGLAILALLLQRLLSDRENPNRDLEAVWDAQGHPQVVLQRNRFGHYVANGRINGEPVVFLVDMGATDVALPLRVARRIGIPLGAVRMAKTANGNIQTWSAWLGSVDLGGLTAHRVQALGTAQHAGRGSPVGNELPEAVRAHIARQHPNPAGPVVTP